MRKTNENNASFNDLTVDTAGLQALMHAGLKQQQKLAQRQALRFMLEDVFYGM